MGFVMGAAFVAMLVWAVIVYAGKKADRELERELQAVLMEVRVTLSPGEIQDLLRQVKELEDVGKDQVRSGAMSKASAHRMVKRACIQSAYASIEIKRMFNPEVDEPSVSAST